MAYDYVSPRNLIPKVFLLKRHVYARLLIGEAKTVLDIGSNSYKILVRAVSLDKDASVNPDFVGSALDIPFPAESFDCVSMLELIEHFETEDQIRVLLEAYRVLKHRGALIISTPNISEATRGLHDLLWFVSHWVYARKDLGQHIGELTHSQLKTMLRRTGFAIESEKAFSFVNYMVKAIKK
jgi:ubiquinone/menaquinone biosynthesis C-methylase UbiE